VVFFQQRLQRVAVHVGINLRVIYIRVPIM
jgi:hypothetical protein